MSQAEFIIPTRQKADLIYGSTELTPAGQTLELPPRLVLGYSSLRAFFISDQPFEVEAEDSCSSSGPWVSSGTVPSTLDPVTGLYFFCDTIPLCNPYLRVFATNISGLDQGMFSVCVHGLPLG